MYPFIIFMKAGPYCGYQLDEIIKIKQREDMICGRFYWGYGGVFCHPKRVLQFVEFSLKQGILPVVLFAITPSNFISPIGRITESSPDGKNWQKLPEEIILVGNKYALVATNLQNANLRLNLGEYRALLGDKPGKSLDKYIMYRIDKSCAMFDPNPSPGNREINIALTAILKPPYCVYVK